MTNIIGDAAIKAGKAVDLLPLLGADDVTGSLLVTGGHLVNGDPSKALGDGLKTLIPGYEYVEAGQTVYKSLRGSGGKAGLNQKDVKEIDKASDRILKVVKEGGDADKALKDELKKIEKAGGSKEEVQSRKEMLGTISQLKMSMNAGEDGKLTDKEKKAIQKLNEALAEQGLLPEGSAGANLSGNPGRAPRSR